MSVIEQIHFVQNSCCACATWRQWCRTYHQLGLMQLQLLVQRERPIPVGSGGSVSWQHHLHNTHPYNITTTNSFPVFTLSLWKPWCSKFCNAIKSSRIFLSRDSFIYPFCTPSSLCRLNIYCMYIT